MDEIINLIRSAKDSISAREKLQSDHKLSSIQADAILQMQLRRLTALEADKIKDQEFLAPSIIIIGKIVEFKVNNNITKVSDVYLPDINKVQLYNKSQK